MRCCIRRPDWYGALFLVFMTITVPAFAGTKASPKVTVLFLHHYIEDNQLKADLRLRPHLSEAMIEALHHAIPLYFQTQLRLVEHTRLSGLIPLHRTIAQRTFSLRLDYLPEKRQWRLINFDSGRVRLHALLGDALDTLGTYMGIPLSPLQPLHPGIHYTVDARFSLQRRRLPAPLWLKSLGDPAWQLDSGWYQTDVDARKLWQR